MYTVYALPLPVQLLTTVDICMEIIDRQQNATAVA